MKKSKINYVRASEAASAIALALALGLTGCTPSSSGALGTSQSGNSSVSAEEAAAEVLNASNSETFFSTDTVHSITIDMDEAEYEAMLDAYASTGDKEWISVDITIDGTTLTDVGLRLKGNRTLREMFAKDRGITLTEEDLDGEETADGEGTSANSKDPSTVPWLIRLDKFVDGQSYMGRYDFVVRQNNTETYLNEAVMMAMMNEAELSTQEVAFTSFAVNGGDPTLRLVIEVPDDKLWNEEWLGAETMTWKADSDGDWNYHGEDGADYEDIWKQRTGDDMAPVVDFMNFINNSTDEEFEAELANNLDVEAFAKYLPIEDLFGNSDTISGPGNNGYLSYNPTTGLMTVIAWDHDLGLGVGQGGMRGRGQMGANATDGITATDGTAAPQPLTGEAMGEPPAMDETMAEEFGNFEEGMAMGERPEPPAGVMGPGGQMGERPEMGGVMPGAVGETTTETETSTGRGQMRNQNNGQMGPNILETRFRASETFQNLYQEAYTELKASLIESGFAQEVLENYTTLLETGASELVSSATIQSDSAAISSYLARDLGSSTPRG